jgi:hypothetical protein
MGKGPLRVQKKKNSEQVVTFDPRMSMDKRTFTLRVENSGPDSWSSYLHMVMAWAHQEIKELERPNDAATH